MGRGIAQNVIFWGAGATKELGIRTTEQQEQFIRCITGAYDSDKTLKERVDEALGPNVGRWHGALFSDHHPRR